MKRRAGCEDIVDQQDMFVFDLGGVVYGKRPAKIREAFLFREGCLRHRRPDSAKAGKQYWDLEMLT